MIVFEEYMEVVKVWVKLSSTNLVNSVDEILKM